MPQLPSGLKLYLSSLCVLDLQRRTDWFKCGPGNFWHLTPNLTVSPPPYRPHDEITLDFVSAPVPKNRDEAMQFVHVLFEDPEYGIYWRGDWMPTFHDHYPLSKEDRNYWLNWIGQNDDFLDHVIAEARKQETDLQRVTGKYKNTPSDYMIGMKMPAFCLGKEIVEERIFFYPLSQLMQRRHRLPSGLCQMDYEVGLNVIGSQLQKAEFKIDRVNNDSSADFSFLATNKGARFAIKVITCRAPDEPIASRDDIFRLKRVREAQRFLVAPVGLLPVAGRSPEGHLGFHVKFTEFIEV